MTAMAALETAAVLGVAVVAALAAGLAVALIGAARADSYCGRHRGRCARPAAEPEHWRHAHWRESRPRHGGVHRRPPRLTIPHTTLSLI